MRHLSSPGNRRANTKRTNLYKSAVRHKFAVGAVMTISGLAAVAATALPPLVSASVDDKQASASRSSQNTKVLVLGDSITAGYRPTDSSGNKYDNHAPCGAMQAALVGVAVSCNGQVGSTTVDWSGDGTIGGRGYLGILENAGFLNPYKGQVVAITLGINDLWQNIPANDSARALKNIVERLRAAGVDKVIINYPSANENGISSSERQELQNNIAKMVDGETVLLGDTSSQSFMAGRSEYYSFDGTHLSADGYDKLGQFWAEAYKRVLLDPQTTNYAVTANGDTVSYSISKDSSWFKPATGYFSNILVDDQIVDQTNYVVTGDGSNTKIVLNSNYVKMLNKTAKHTITVRFNDGVNFSDEFELKTGDNTNNSNSGDNNNTGNQNQNANNDQTANTTKPVVNGKVTIAAPNTGYRR